METDKMTQPKTASNQIICRPRHGRVHCLLENSVEGLGTGMGSPAVLKGKF